MRTTTGRSAASLVAAVSLLALLVGCGKPSSSGAGTKGYKDCISVKAGKGDPQAGLDKFQGVGEELQSAPELELAGCAKGKGPDELYRKDVVEGEGAEVPDGATVTVNYLGVTWPKGKKFDSSWERNEPATFGLKQVIPGWGQGLTGTKVGSRVLLVIPPDLAYGEQGQPPTIDPNATLVFVVDVLAVKEAAQVPDALKTKPTVEYAKGSEPPTQLVTEDIVVGTGAEATAADTVTVNYVGVNWQSGQEFDSSWDRGQPAEFPLQGVIPGFRDGIAGMKVGGRRKIVIPPALGYGPQGGRPPKIGATDTLVFVVDLIDVQKG